MERIFEVWRSAQAICRWMDGGKEVGVLEAASEIYHTG
jgi:hypothetical protein